MIALRHDPGSGTGPLSLSIQTALLLTRCLDAPGTPYDPAPSSGGLFGRKSFIFTDKLDVTNRLYWDFQDAEGWWQKGKPKNERVLTLAHLRAEVQARRPPAKQESSSEREPGGQWWWLPEQLGRDLSGDEQLNIGRTSSQDAGVDLSRVDAIVATATLEVGYDDPDVGAVLQHKSPHDAARFLQRKGRAGRDPEMRPWTVVVLSDWGRDRVAWELYDQLFDPELDPRHLPLHNRYVLRMQAVYSTLDWLGRRLADVGDDRSAWNDAVAPAEHSRKGGQGPGAGRETKGNGGPPEGRLGRWARSRAVAAPPPKRARLHERRLRLVRGRRVALVAASPAPSLRAPDTAPTAPVGMGRRSADTRQLRGEDTNAVA